MTPSETTRISTRFLLMLRRPLIQALRILARLGGVKPPPGGWRDDRRTVPVPARPLKRSRVVAQQRECRETRRTLVRLCLWLPPGLFGFFLMVQLQTPEQLALHRLRKLATTNATPLPAPPRATLKKQDHSTLTFNELSWFDFTVTPDIYDGRANPASASAQTQEQIPESVRRFDGNAVALQGFMLPLKLRHGKAVEWLLCRDQSDCCFGKTPRMNHWVLVRSPQGVKPKMGQPVICFGNLRVGEMRDGGFLTGIYQMDAVDARLTE